MRKTFDRFIPRLSRVLLWVGSVLLLLALASCCRSWNGTRALLRATATVTNNIAAFGPKGGVLYFPRVRFRAANGSLVQALTEEGSEDAEFATGESLPILYSAKKPESAVIATRWRVYKWAILLGIAGVLVFDLGLLAGYGGAWLRERKLSL